MNLDNGSGAEPSGPGPQHTGTKKEEPMSSKKNRKHHGSTAKAKVEQALEQPATEPASSETPIGLDKGKPARPKKPKAPTISEYMVELLRAKEVGTNDQLIAAVKARFPLSKVNEAHIAWYKGAFQDGRLHGQGGKGETFNQPFTSEYKRAQAEKRARKQEQVAS